MEPEEPVEIQGETYIWAWVRPLMENLLPEGPEPGPAEPEEPAECQGKTYSLALGSLHMENLRRSTS